MKNVYALLLEGVAFIGVVISWSVVNSVLEFVVLSVSLITALTGFLKMIRKNKGS